MELAEGVKKLLEDTGLFGARVYPYKMPQTCKQVPVAVYTHTSTHRSHELTQDSNYTYENYQISIHGKNPTETRAAWKTVRKIFQNYTGELSGQEVTCQLQWEELSFDGSQEEGYTGLIDIEFQYQEK